MKLNLGCGKEKLDGYLGVDFKPPCDMQCDLRVLPWPWADGSVDEVRASHFLEHCSDPVRVVEEIHRILKPNGKLVVIAPYFTSVTAFYNLEHKCFFAWDSLSFFGDNEYQYSDKARFTVVKRALDFPRVYGWVSLFAERWPKFYEGFLCWMLPARQIRYELVKQEIKR